MSVSDLQLLNPALTNLRVDGSNRVIVPSSVSANLDHKISALAGLGGQPSAPARPTTDYVATKEPVLVNTQAAQELAQNNTLPTTSSDLTALRTVTQEPPLSDEERNFIAEQIRVHAAESVQAVNMQDGKIDLNSIQTGQSVLEGTPIKKTVQFDSNSTLAGRGTVSGAQTIAPNRTVNSATHHTVKSGDTLGGLAERYDVSVQQLREWNQMGTESKIMVGQRLRIVPPTNVAPTKPKPATATRSEVYVVKSGDTLSGIADKHGLKLSQLANYNDIPATTKVQTGQKLWLVPNKTTGNQTASTAPARDTQATTYTVKSGDTLTGVANRFGITKEVIAAANGMKPTDGLVAGRALTIPTAKGKTAPVKAATKATTAKATTYMVKSGDTLIAVANRHNISVDELAAANKLSKTAGLTIGQKLTIPTAGGTRATAPTAPATNTATGGQVIKKTENYTVKSGDTLTSIAGRYGVSVADLARTNGLPANTRLGVGQTIKVPKLTTTHKVKSGETLNGLAKRYGISVDELAKMNGLKPKDRLKTNQTITIPNK